MLEKSGFSLARAGVMAGLVGIVFLGAGFFSQHVSKDTASNVHLSEALWSGVDRLLAHVQADAKAKAINGALLRDPPLCTPLAPGHARLAGRVEVFNQQLAQLHQQGFVKSLYQLDPRTWLSDPALRQTSCPDAEKPLQWLLSQTRQSGTLFLESLQWKERQPNARSARFSQGHQVFMDQQAMRTRSPWQGLPGCVFWTDAITGQPVLAGRSAQASLKFCEAQFQRIDHRASGLVAPPVLPGLAQVLEPLSVWRLPQSPLYQRMIGERNQGAIKGPAQAVGLHSQLGIDPRWQNSLQRIAQCFTGAESAFCNAMAVGGAERYEGARVRMAGVAVVDIPSGRLVAAASASSPCFEYDKSRAGLAPPDCPLIAEGNVHRPRLPQGVSNHALFTQAPPGSLVKPVMMAGILQSPQPKASLAGLDKALQRSDSQHFLDAMLCRKQLGSGLFYPDCERPQRILESIHHLGWNAGCDAREDWQRARCGMIDLLRGTALAETPASVDARWLEANLYRPVQLPVLAGQLMVEVAPNDAPGWRDMRLSGLLPSPEQRLLCAQSGRKGYVRCGGPRMALISEGYGQGNAMATPVGVAGMLAVLAGSAQGLPGRYPHVLQNFWTTAGQPDEVTRQLAERQGLSGGPQGLSPEISRRILEVMETTHSPGGTAHAACKKVMGETLCLSSLGVAGKTGTPGDADDRSLQQLMRDQSLHNTCMAQGKARCHEAHPLPRPRYRWYAAAFKSEGSAQYDKAIAVLVHSNWRRVDGRYADENNAAAEMAFHAIRQVREIKSVP